MRSIRFRNASASLSVISILTLASGCATVHPGTLAQPLHQNAKIPLTISAVNVDAQPDRSYVLVYLTFENRGDRWVKIASSEVQFDSEAATQYSVVVGKDLQDWAEAMTLTHELEKQNRSVIQSTLLIAGGALFLGSSGRSSTTAALVNDIGAATLVGVGGYMAYEGIRESKLSRERPAWVPDTHLSQPFSLPARMFIRKWVLINKPVSKTLKTLKFDLKTVEGESETYEVQI